MDCVKLGDPGGAEDRRGVRARIGVRKRRNGRGAKAGQEDGCGKAGTMEINNPCQWWRRLRKRKTSRPPGCGGTITPDRPHVGGPGNGIKGGKRQPLERNLQMEPKCLLSWAGLFSSSTVMSRNANPYNEDNHQLESRMREIRLSGLEGGVGRKPYPYPYPVMGKPRYF